MSDNVAISVNPSEEEVRPSLAKEAETPARAALTTQADPGSKKQKRIKRRVAEAAVYTGLGAVALAEPWLLLLIVPALAMALKD
ncbi:hypothetical protein [Streptomyces fumanus]|uniref:Uncharacterized protein n=1 Tax=Streptomyces fumanus TaxID=67302 RepID=A0A919AT25_9ACTN|nr:hypothetical protein [Streptomyces fumanus]GHF24748.1 hypothetical protein GCM10018772_58200 [Streptomyces fumanus]